MNRVAAIITNYNMPERTDALVEYIRKNVKTPCDIVVVDNGSDLAKPSKYTTLKLDRNCQTTNGWLAGLDSIVNKQYFAYWFLITSTEFTEESHDPLTPMVEQLNNDANAVGVHNALTSDSTTAWEHLKARGGKGCRRTWMIDNISSLYRAAWFDYNGQFDHRLIYGWGIDLETCYKARKEGRGIYVCEDARVKKVTDIGYSMQRMNMNATERRKLASENMRDILQEKYGDMWNWCMRFEYIEKDWL